MKGINQHSLCDFSVEGKNSLYQLLCDENDLFGSSKLSVSKKSFSR